MMKRSIQFSDLVDIKRVKCIFEHFYQLTKSPSALLDADGTILVAFGWQKICLEFHRKHPEMSRRCHESDRFIQQHLSKEGYVEYRCKNGLWDIAAPIKMKDVHVGTVFLGQFFYEDEKIDHQAFEKQALTFGLDRDAYMTALDQVPRFSRERVKQIMAMYTDMANLLTDMAEETAKLREQIQFDNEMRSLEKALIQSRSIEKTSEIVLKSALKLTNSPYGFVGFIDPLSGHLVVPTFTRDIWAKQCTVDPREQRIEFTSFTGLWGWVLNERRPLLVNTPEVDERSIGVPKGHLKIDNFLAVPVMADGELLGEIAVANTPGTYTPKIQQFLERLSGLYALSIRDNYKTGKLSSQKEELEVSKSSLEYSVSLLKSILEATGDGIIVTDNNGKILQCNRVFMEMWDVPDDVISQKDHRRIVQYLQSRVEDPQQFAKTIEQFYNSSDEIQTNIIKVTDGAVIKRVSKPFELKGQMVGKICSFRDITLRYHQENEIKQHKLELETMVQERTSELQRSNDELKHFAYVVSHDLQEPNRMVINFMELLKYKYDNQLDERANQYISFAVEGAHRMRRLIKDILTYSRVHSEKKAFEDVDLNRVLQDVQKDLVMSIDENSARIICSAMPTVVGDSTQIRQLFQNLISNAIKYRREAPPFIHIHCKKENECWQFSIQDNGIGIAEKHYDRIFKLFQRLHHRDEYSGTGLGLALVHRILVRHGGKIWLQSEPGKGSTFYFTLPYPKSEQLNRFIPVPG